MPGPATIDLDGVTYDIDYVGMDDGRAPAPDAALRIIFQLGHGYMIHLYVVQAGATGRPQHFFHTFWLKDCAVAEVEMEEYGPPARVTAPPCALPPLFAAVEVEIEGGDAPRHLAIAAARFEAPDADRLELRFALGGGGALRWSRRQAWELIEADGTARPLAPGTLPRFDAAT